LIEPAGGETAHVVPDQVLVDVPGDDEFILVGDEHHASVPGQIPVIYNKEA
jgi:hypothetical protein